MVQFCAINNHKTQSSILFWIDAPTYSKSNFKMVVPLNSVNFCCVWQNRQN